MQRQKRKIVRVITQYGNNIKSARRIGLTRNRLGYNNCVAVDDNSAMLATADFRQSCLQAGGPATPTQFVPDKLVVEQQVLIKYMPHKCKNHRKGGFDIYGAHIRIRT